MEDSVVTIEHLKDKTVEDEILLALIKENPLLYNKKHPHYKNQEIKRDTWNMIKIHCNTSSAEEVENRWNQLRNYFGKKLREMKAKPASGSGGGVKSKKGEWYLTGAMSFLIPYISHRRGRSSFGKLSSSTPSDISSPASLQTSVSGSIDFIQDDNVDNVDIVIDDNTSLVCESSACFDGSVETKSETKAVPLKRKKVVPKLDASAKKKKRDNDIKSFLAQSSSALTNLATVLHKSIAEPASDKIDKEKDKKNPFAESILLAFDQVPAVKQVECLIAILNIIKSYQAI